jgi:hypothetical protein
MALDTWRALGLLRLWADEGVKTASLVMTSRQLDQQLVDHSQLIAEDFIKKTHLGKTWHLGQGPIVGFGPRGEGSPSSLSLFGT